MLYINIKCEYPLCNGDQPLPIDFKKMICITLNDTSVSNLGVEGVSRRSFQYRSLHSSVSHRKIFKRGLCRFAT